MGWSYGISVAVLTKYGCSTKHTRSNYQETKYRQNRHRKTFFETFSYNQFVWSWHEYDLKSIAQYGSECTNGGHDNWNHIWNDILEYLSYIYKQTSCTWFKDIFISDLWAEDSKQHDTFQLSKFQSGERLQIGWHLIEKQMPACDSTWNIIKTTKRIQCQCSGDSIIWRLCQAQNIPAKQQHNRNSQCKRSVNVSMLSHLNAPLILNAHLYKNQIIMNINEIKYQ